MKTTEEMVAEMVTLSQQAQQDPGGVQRIRITELAPEGSVIITQIVDEERERLQANGIKDPQEAMIHPEDWKRMKELIRSKAPEEAPLIGGIPVIGAP